MNMSEFISLLKTLIELIKLVYQIYQDKKRTATSAKCDDSETNK